MISIPNLCAVVVLCGGESRRMGRDKALVDLDGSPVLRRHIDEIRSLNLQVPLYISSGAKRYAILDDCGVTYVPDVVPGAGPLSGLAGALNTASDAGGANDHVFAMPVDTLLPASILLAELTKASVAASDVVLIKGQRLHPVHGLFPVSLAQPLKQFIESGGRAVMGFLDGLDIEEVAIDENWEPCMNFNDPDEFVAACEVLAQITALKSQP